LKTWFGLRKISDRTEKYWGIKAKQKKIDDVMESICDGWDKSKFDGEQTQFIKFVRRNLNSDMIILDLACGIGRNCKWTAPYVGMYHGIDFIPEMIEKAKRITPGWVNVTLSVNDGKTIPFNDDYFDLIFSEIAIQHMKKPIQDSYFKEIYRTLKKGGIFMGQIPKMSFYNNDEYARTDIEIENIFENYDYTLLDGHEAYYTVRAVKL
jgi:ubiquinone/menaquinone biosynthesis C-methylase UbiE